jgi:hypothetical protein
MLEQAVDEPAAATPPMDDAVDLERPAAAGAVEAGADEVGTAKATTLPRERDTSGAEAFDAQDGPAEEAGAVADRADGGDSAPEPTAAAVDTEPMTMELRAPPRSSDGELPAPGESSAEATLAPGGAVAPPSRDETAPSVADGLAATSTGETAAEDGMDVARFLIPAGIVLAAAGLVLLVLAWLSRRAADPLLR